MKTSLLGALTLVLTIIAPIVHADTTITRIQIAEARPRDLEGFALGMTPDEILSVAKAQGWLTQVTQLPKQSGGSYVDRVDVQAAYRTTVSFSIATGKAIRVIAFGKYELTARSGPLYEAATKKFGEPDPSDSSEIRTGWVYWGGKQSPFAIWKQGSWDGGEGSSFAIIDQAATAEDQAARHAPAKPGPAL